MADVTVKKLDEFDTRYGGAFKLVRHGLGVQSFGVAVFEMPPNIDAYPEHDHAADEQEEVYTALEGSATIQVGDERHDLQPGTFVRVGPREKRKIVTGDQPVRVLAVGGTPGKPYSVSELSLPENGS
jgi:uncharacterized cupin superfamily protein